MKLKLLYFARLREQVGVAVEEVDLPLASATVGAVRLHLAARGPIWEEALASQGRVRVAVNQLMAADETALQAGDEVAFFPPVTGG